jgi:hypothetical protein
VTQGKRDADARAPQEGAPPHVDEPIRDLPVACQVCGTTHWPEEPVLCRVCGEPLPGRR